MPTSSSSSIVVGRLLSELSLMMKRLHSLCALWNQDYTRQLDLQTIMQRQDMQYQYIGTKMAPLRWMLVAPNLSLLPAKQRKQTVEIAYWIDNVQLLEMKEGSSLALLVLQFPRWTALALEAKVRRHANDARVMVIVS